MEVMHRAVIKNRALKPLPSEITPVTINGATLPVKIETARRAIAACTELPELLRYKSQAEGLSAAVRTMKEVGPEMIRAANEMMADAWRKGGELLSAYSNVSKVVVTKGVQGLRGGTVTPRTLKAKEVGLTKNEAAAMVRLAKAPAHVAYAAAHTTKNMRLAANKTPAVSPEYSKYKRSEACRAILGSGNSGLCTLLGIAKHVNLAHFKQLAPDERKLVKAKITEIMELLDEMDRLCK